MRNDCMIRVSKATKKKLKLGALNNDLSIGRYVDKLLKNKGDENEEKDFFKF